MCQSMVNIQSPAAEIRRGKKKEEGRTNHSMKIYMVSLLHRATIKNKDVPVHISCHPITDKTNRMLNVFNRRCLRDIMGVPWKDHMTNEELLSSPGIGDLHGIVADRRRRFIGHVLRFPTSQPASLVIDWTLEGGSRRWGRPKWTWQDTCREDLQEMGVSGSDTHEARSIASDRAQWRQLVASVPVGTGGPKSK